MMNRDEFHFVCVCSWCLVCVCVWRRRSRGNGNEVNIGQTLAMDWNDASKKWIWPQAMAKVPICVYKCSTDATGDVYIYLSQIIMACNTIQSVAFNWNPRDNCLIVVCHAKRECGSAAVWLVANLVSHLIFYEFMFLESFRYRTHNRTTEHVRTHCMRFSIDYYLYCNQWICSNIIYSYVCNVSQLNTFKMDER